MRTGLMLLALLGDYLHGHKFQIAQMGWYTLNDRTRRDWMTHLRRSILVKNSWMFDYGYRLSIQNSQFMWMSHSNLKWTTLSRIDEIILPVRKAKDCKIFCIVWISEAHQQYRNSLAVTIFPISPSILRSSPPPWFLHKFPELWRRGKTVRYHNR